MENSILEELRPNAESTKAEIRKFLLHLIAFKYEPLATDEVKAHSQEIIDNAHIGFISQIDMENQLIDLYVAAFGNLEI